MNEQITLTMGASNDAWSELKKSPPTARFGLLVILCYVLAGIFAPLLTPYGETQVIGQPFELWGDEFVLGTDNRGRDMLTRLVYGARNTVGIALATTCLAFLIGAVTGIMAAVFRGWTDQLLSRTADVLVAIPQLIFALLLLTIFGTNIGTLILVIAVLDSARAFRLTRAVSLNVVALNFVEAARLRGEGTLWLSVYELLPNIFSPLISEFGLRFCAVFLTIAALGFLGMGLQSPTADLGLMVHENASQIAAGNITPLLPAAAIALLAVAINFVVDWFLHKSSNPNDKD